MKRIAGILIVTAGSFLSLGCQMTSVKPAASQPRIAELPPIPDRLRAFYQDIRAGKFEILADFEQPAHTEIFHVDGTGSAQLTVRRSRIPTGAGGLEARLDDPESILVVDAQTASNWTLPRDWSRYQLLMASVHAPYPVVVDLQIRSGTDEPAWYASNPKPLQGGWNLLRIDLGEVGRRINLTDIRQIRLTASAPAWPLTIYLDDLVLADNTTVTFGDPAGPPGSLYVLRKGQRHHVGSVGRFELVFARGLLTSWYDLANDPARTVDLAGGGPVGPVLTALDETGSPLGGIGIESWTHLGKAVQTHLQVVETSPLAVTIKGTLRFTMAAAGSVDATSTQEVTTQPAMGAVGGVVPTAKPSSGEAGPASAADSQPAAIEHTYLYTIRQDGRVFLDASATVATSAWRPARLGLTITNLGAVFQSRHVDPLDAELLNPPGGTATGSQPAVDVPLDAPQRSPIPRALLLAAVRSGGASLLLAPCNVGQYERVVSATRQTGDVTAHMYVMDAPADDKLRLAALLAVWPPDLKDLPTAAAIARDYQQPSLPQVEVGKLRSDTEGDLDGDGYAEATGRWMVEPDGQVLRLRWPAGQLRFWPMLQVTGLSGKACWPYLDGRIIKPVHRRSDGNAEFVMPGILSREALLEVTVEKQQQELASQPAATQKAPARWPVGLFRK